MSPLICRRHPLPTAYSEVGTPPTTGGALNDQPITCTICRICERGASYIPHHFAICIVWQQAIVARPFGSPPAKSSVFTANIRRVGTVASAQHHHRGGPASKARFAAIIALGSRKETYAVRITPDAARQIRAVVIIEELPRTAAFSSTVHAKSRWPLASGSMLRRENGCCHARCGTGF